MTAVEYLLKLYIGGVLNESLFKHAMKMEKDQIYDSFCSGAWYENQNIDKSADEYYNETYGE